MESSFDWVLYFKMIKILFSFFLLCLEWEKKDVVLSILSTFLWQIFFCFLYPSILSSTFFSIFLIFYLWMFGSMFSVIRCLLISLTIVYSVLNVKKREQQQASFNIRDCEAFLMAQNWWFLLLFFFSLWLFFYIFFWCVNASVFIVLQDSWIVKEEVKFHECHIQDNLVHKKSLYRREKESKFMCIFFSAFSLLPFVVGFYFVSIVLSSRAGKCI